MVKEVSPANALLREIDAERIVAASQQKQARIKQLQRMPNGRLRKVLMNSTDAEERTRIETIIEERRRSNQQ